MFLGEAATTKAHHTPAQRATFYWCGTQVQRTCCRKSTATPLCATSTHTSQLWGCNACTIRPAWDTYRATIAAKVSAQPFIAARCSQGTRRRDNDVNSAPWCTMTAAVLSFPLCNAHSSAFCPHCHQFKQAWRIKDVYSTRHAQCSYGGHRGRGSSACKQILGDLLPPFLCRVHERCFARLWDVETASENTRSCTLGNLPDSSKHAPCLRNRHSHQPQAVPPQQIGNHIDTLWRVLFRSPEE